MLQRHDADRQEAVATSAWPRWKTSPGWAGWPGVPSRLEWRWAGWLGLADRPRLGEWPGWLSWTGPKLGEEGNTNSEIDFQNIRILEIQIKEILESKGIWRNSKNPGDLELRELDSSEF
jgi:hypothetical protein